MTMFKQVLCLCLVASISVLNVSCNHDPLEDAHRFAYALRTSDDIGTYILNWLMPACILSKIDLKTFKVVEEFTVNYNYDNMAIDNEGTLYLSNYRENDRYQNVIDQLKPNARQLTPYITTRYGSPTQLYKTDHVTTVLLGTGNSLPLSFGVFNPDGTWVKNIPLTPYGTTEETLHQVNNKLQGIIWDYFQPSVNALVTYDLEKGNLISRDPVPDRFGKIASFAHLPSGNTAYLGPYIDQLSTTNSSIFHVSLPDFTILNTIDLHQPDIIPRLLPEDILKVSDLSDIFQPQSMIVMPLENKLYVNHWLCISVIDLTTHEHIKTLFIQAYRFVRVDDSVLAISRLPSYPDNEGAELVLLDTKTDTIITSFKGEYGPIATRQFYP